MIQAKVIEGYNSTKIQPEYNSIYFITRLLLGVVSNIFIFTPTYLLGEDSHFD